MKGQIASALAASAAVASAASVPRAQSASITPHDMYSSSIGVLGCHINTNRVAYWPGAVDCDQICVKVSHEGRSVHLLKIDSSGGAHDISYDAWNFLISGKSATESPQQGGGVNMNFEFVPASECSSLLHNGKLPLSASNSMNYVASCLQNQPNSFAAKNHELLNFVDPICKYGYDEVCTLNLQTSNQPTCPHQLGSTHTPTGQHVYNIQYGTGKKVEAQ
ncbi:hypothetical protein VHEMI00769 [[Torrubiella] hemipterigena]|uniref:Cerato-platanin n=1 Tax=[Torrubiella] hemipterigena TaxID=1531966 RepID=A0A0A1T5I9_9HYPO|nr:hypothetical protein VHEMI00769 [[Torrubiella] hemipterigena]